MVSVARVISPRCPACQAIHTDVLPHLGIVPYVATGPGGHSLLLGLLHDVSALLPSHDRPPANALSFFLLLRLPPSRFGSR